VGEDVEKRVEIGLAKDGSGVGGENLLRSFVSMRMLKIIIQLPFAL